MQLCPNYDHFSSPINGKSAPLRALCLLWVLPAGGVGARGQFFGAYWVMISRAPATNSAICSGEKVSSMDTKLSMVPDSLSIIASTPVLCRLATGKGCPTPVKDEFHFLRVQFVKGFFLLLTFAGQEFHYFCIIRCALPPNLII